MGFRPSAISTVTVLVGMGLTIRLGFWQLSRYESKETMLQERRDQHALAPLDSLDGAPSDGFRRVRLSGHYRPEAAVVSGGIPFGRNGYAVIAVLDLDTGGSVLVQRGWIPADDWAPYRTQDTAPRAVEGILHTIEGPPDVQPVQDVRTGLPLWPLEREAFLGVLSRGVRIPWSSLVRDIPGVNPVVAVIEGPELPDAEARKTNRLPAPGYVIEQKTFHHLEYAVQWFSFAGIMAVIWGIVGWRRARLPQATASSQT